MSRTFRFSIARLMGVVILAAIGVAALRESSEAWAGSMLLITLGAIAIALAGAFTREPADRTGWLGFALFGGGYLALAYATSGTTATLPTLSLAHLIQNWTKNLPAVPGAGMEDGWAGLDPRDRVVHCLWALGLAGLGSLLSLVVTAGAVVCQPAPAPDDERSPPRRWLLAVLAGLAASGLLATVAVTRRWPAPGLWAGGAFLISCTALGLAAVGAVLRRGRSRETCLAAALFGFGYLALSVGQPQMFKLAPRLPTEILINQWLEAGVPPVVSEFPDFTTEPRFRVANERIRRKLDEPIAMHFPTETPLDEVLRHIKNATSEPGFPGIPIYVDPIGLQSAERSLNSTVSIDIGAIPVRDALGLCLKQLGLGYAVRSGYLHISDEWPATLPICEDPVQVVGHSLLALVAAAIGAFAARLVSDRIRAGSANHS